MNNENKLKYDELMNQIQELNKNALLLKEQIEQEEKQLKQNKLELWKPKENEEYYIFDAYLDILNLYNNSNFDKMQIDSNNCFQTEEEVQKYVNYIKLSLKILKTRDLLNGDWKPDWNNGNERKYFIYMSNHRIEYDWYYNNKKSFLYFKSEEIREQFRSLITDQEIIEYFSF